jgi:hypothetical protein
VARHQVYHLLARLDAGLERDVDLDQPTADVVDDRYRSRLAAA